ncbi:phosphoglycerate kinase, partial [candidate division WOR-3 bacterium RBG_13_43_14]
YFSDPACGFLMEKEIAYLRRALKDPKRPLIAIIGGAKVSTKIKVIKNLLNTVDQLVVGGGMCFTFYKAKGYNIGKSICENDFVDQVKELVDNKKLYLPEDIIVSADIKQGSPVRMVSASSIPDDHQGVDIGEKSRSRIIEIIGSAGTVVWNGPMGIFEIANFARGTEVVARAFAGATANGTITIAGGGDTVAAIEKYGLSEKISHVSTGGGASLEFLEGIELPGIKILKEKS